MRTFLLILIGLVFAVSTQVQAQDEAKYKVDPKDVSSVDGILAAMYDVISGPAGQARNWDRLRAICTADARLNAVSKNKEGISKFRSMTIDDYIQGSEPLMMKWGLTEKELGRKVHTYGDITQVFSAYELTIAPGTDKEKVIRGINSYQLIFHDDRYWVLSVLWTPETEDNPLPEEYLK